MKAKARFALDGGGAGSRDLQCDVDVDASFGDYGRSDTPMMFAHCVDEGASFTLMFASADDARLLGERLFALARKAEEKVRQRGPEYRAQLIREEALTEMRALAARVEVAMNHGGKLQLPAELAALSP